MNYEGLKAREVGKTWDFELLPEKVSKETLEAAIRTWLHDHPNLEVVDIEYGYGVLPAFGAPQGWYSAMIIYRLSA